MIGLPFNDHGCLGAITDQVADLVEQRDPALVELAARFPDTAALAGWLRSLPQRDDVGDPQDGPHVEACDPPQRLRIAAADPNCLERTATYIAVAELLDPGPARQMATIDTGCGKHTFPVENGTPVILDPRVSRNALEAGLFRAERGPVRMTPRQTVDWLTSLAEEPSARYRNGRQRVRRARRALRAMLKGRPLRVRNAGDVGFTLALADREARRFGGRGTAVARTTRHALGTLDATASHRNAPELHLGKYRVRPHVGTLAALARVGGRLGARVGTAALRVKLASWGINDLMLREVERELNAEGLTLGELAAPPPMPGSLAAVTTDALAGRWLASRTG